MGRVRADGAARPRHRPGALEVLVGPERYRRTQQRVGMTVTAVMLIGVLASIALAGDTIESSRRPQFVVLCGVALLLAVVTVVMTRRGVLVWFDAMALGSPALAAVGVHLAGARRADYVMLLTSIGAMAVVFIRPRLAAASVAVSMGAYAVIVSTADGYPAPASRIALALVCTGTALVLFTWLFGKLEELAAAERAASARVAAANRTLQQFLSPQIAAAVLDGDDARLLAPHRRQIAVVFVDLRGFTAFTTGAEPEDVVDLLEDFYAAFGEEAERLDATFGSYSGDGAMAYFGDPLPCDDPAAQAVALARALRSRLGALSARWRQRGHQIGHGIGVAYGYATMGIVGHHNRREYTPLGSVVNLASRLCAEASDGEILVDTRTYAATDQSQGASRDVGLKGFPHPVRAFAV